MEALYSSETAVATQRNTRRHIPEDDTLQFLKFGIPAMLVIFIRLNK
jgi:hypothetical protein